MTRQVQLSDDAYARLTAAKLPGESFSDVVLRLTGKKTLASFRTGRTDAEIAAHEKALRDVQALDEADVGAGRSRRRGTEP